MAFNLGYVSVCQKDILHLYTTTTLKKPAQRQPRQYQPEFWRDFDAQIRLRLKNRRFMEYLPKHEIELPRAPAFRNIPKGEVDEIVNRLNMAPGERFNFKHKDSLPYNDWRTAREEKIHKLRETMKKFGSANKKTPRKQEKKKHKKERKHKKESVKEEEDKKLPVI